MLSRERLWQRVAGAPAWALPWGMAAASALPWVVPETWDGQVPRWGYLAGWGALALGLLLLRRRGGAWVWVALALPWLTLLGLGRAARLDAALPLEGLTEVSGAVTEGWTLRGERRISRLFVASPQALAGLELPLSLPAEGASPPPPGAMVRFRTELEAVSPAPVFLGERPLWRARSDGSPRRIRLRSAEQLELLGPPRPSPLLRLRTFVHARFAALPLGEGPARDLWGALTLGIPPARDEVFSAFAESGTIHTLVVSGLQVTLIMGFLEALGRRTLRRGGTALAVVGGLLYAAIVGFSAPVWRGLLMGVAWALGRRSGWRVPPVLTLHGALAAWLLGHPAAGAEPGFLLAWMALLGLLWVAEPLAGLMSPLLGRLALPAARFAGPWLTTLPLLALLHGGAPLWGIAANLMVLPLVGLLTPLCLFLTFVPVPGVVAATGALLGWMGTSLVPAFARIQPLATGWLSPWLALLLGWLALAHGHALLRRTRALALVLVTGSLLLVAVRGTGSAPRTLVLEAPDLGQGDGLLLRVPGGDATVIDTGPSPWAARRLARVLSRRGVREPVHLVVTHPHGDHAGGWATLARLWPLASVTIPGVARPEARWAPFSPGGEVGGANAALRGDAWTRGGARTEVRWPPKPFDLPDPNMVSLVLRVRWRDRELWLMGDALAIQERDLLDLGDPGAWTGHRLLKPGHHGSASASDPKWVQAVRPGLVLFTVGRSNRFEFPAAATLEVLRGAGDPPTVASGPAGGVQVSAEPWGWRIREGNGRERRVSPGASGP